jgi:predicted acetyltransferase
MKLVSPNKKYKDSFLQAVRDHKQSGEHDGGFDAHEYEWFEKHFEDMVKNYLDESEGKNLRDGRVPQTTLWVVDGDKYLGRFSLRHKLNEVLETYGGHLGYYLVPEARKKGVGTWAMNKVLEKARALGLKKLLVTCDPDNIGSQKLIQKFGGIHQDTIDSKLNDGPLMRWWITL